MNRFLNDVPWILGVLIIGLLLGSYIGQSSGLWWLIIGLAVVAITLGVFRSIASARSKTTAV